MFETALFWDESYEWTSEIRGCARWDGESAEGLFEKNKSLITVALDWNLAVWVA